MLNKPAEHAFILNVTEAVLYKLPTLDPTEQVLQPLIEAPFAKVPDSAS
jgi:hypothetical protein